MDFRVISIGSLSAHPLWEEKYEMRTAHATCTLVRSEDRVILINPGLPADAMVARLFERSALRPDQVTDVFLTDFRPDRRLGLLAFTDANWWISEMERESVGVELITKFQDIQGDPEMEQLFKTEISMLQKCQSAPDSLAPQVDLFPLYGVTPGSCGVILTLPRQTVVIAGDVVASSEHLEQGKVLQNVYDVKMTQEAFQEVIEIADWIIPGHDNILPNMSRLSGGGFAQHGGFPGMDLA